jgi:uncharacterized repeat protein (TIGR03803 family)
MSLIKIGKSKQFLFPSYIGKCKKWSVAIAGAVAFVMITAPVLHAQTVPFTPIYLFQGGADGYLPGSMFQGSDNNLYGTLVSGGAYGWGKVFQLTKGGTLTTLHTFDYTDGGDPADLIQGTDGNLYGVAAAGGSTGFGAIYRLTVDGAFATLYTFTGGLDGDAPGALLQASDGNVYGSATFGGIYNTGNTGCVYGCGALFKLTTGGDFSTLYDFPVGSVGSVPTELIEGQDGNLYGETQDGGAYYAGTIYRMSLTGELTTLHVFTGGVDGYILSGLIQGSDGNFYGTTIEGGAISAACSIGCGTVYQLTPNGILTTLHSFAYTDGVGPFAGVTEGFDGNFYGTTQQGGSSPNCQHGCGTIFQLTPAGVLTTLHQFSYGDGAYPEGVLVQASDGSFYGTTGGGGNTNGTIVYGFGSVFHFQLPTGPIAPTGLVATVKQLGKVALTWAAAPGAVSYNVYQGAPAQESTTPVQSGLTKASATIKGLKRKQTYCFTVAGVDANGVGYPSNEACITAK